jgi:hypothetical protein
MPEGYHNGKTQKWVNDVLAQNSVKVNDVLTHPGKRCPDTYHLGASRTGLRPFSQGRISKKIPPAPTVTPYFEVCARMPLGVSRHFVKPQNMGSPPTHTIDAALRNGAWPRTQRA